MESLRLKKTGVKDKHGELYGGGGGSCFPLQPSCVCCLSLPSLSGASATSTRKQNKTKEKRKLYPPFPVLNQTCSRGTWKEAKNVAQSSLSNFQVYYFLPLFQPLLVVLATSRSAFIQHLIQWRCEDEVGQRGRETCNCLKHTLSITRCFFGTNHHSVILCVS